MPASVAANKTNEMQSNTIRLSSKPQVVGAPQSPDWSTIQSLTSYANSMMKTMSATAYNAAMTRLAQT